MASILVDSSPQLGRNYLCVREDRFRYPRAIAHDSSLMLKYDWSKSFETRIMPLSTLGKGRSGTSRKTNNIANLSVSEGCCDEVRIPMQAFTCITLLCNLGDLGFKARGFSKDFLTTCWHQFVSKHCALDSEYPRICPNHFFKSAINFCTSSWLN